MFGKRWFGQESNGVLPGSNKAPVTSSEVMERLAVDYMKDLKWRRYFKFLLLGLFILYIVTIGLFAKKAGGPNPSLPHTALVELNGVIGTEAGTSADKINASLRKAFAARQSKGVVLRINSPGGTPVQSAEINEEITRLRGLYPDKPMHVVVSDLCASGGYYIAVAAETIFVNPSSIVGSIGVRMDSFGFVDTLEKAGVERRSITAGKNKALLDPFLPLQQDQLEHAKNMLAIVHQQFINAVKKGRGDKLSNNPDLFSGLFWSGEQAKDLGLVDEYGSLDYVAREVIGHEDVFNYTQQPSFLEQFSRDFGVSIGTGLANVFGNQFDRVMLK